MSSRACRSCGASCQERSKCGQLIGQSAYSVLPKVDIKFYTTFIGIRDLYEFSFNSGVKKNEIKVGRGLMPIWF